jgi:transcriptional regulator with XRE-family HTH domain
MQRDRIRLSQEKLALLAGLDRTKVRKIESYVASPSREILIKITAKLGIK